jgi:CubicO group peptidase (beta-lactamase class C family)
VYAADTPMPIASASKWIYGAYVTQLRAGALTDQDIKFLNFRSGYTNFNQCQQGQSVDECLAFENNGVYDPSTDGMFSYGGGHMQKHASLISLGPLHNDTLATEIRAKIGVDIALIYTQPQLAGGIFTTASDYAIFLRRLLDGQLKLGSMLGSHAVCTNPMTCAQALNTPVPLTESWNYSLGHWVEVDPVVGDGAFSSAGAFGFYPWIDASKTWYGIVARKQGILDPAPDRSLGEGYRSAQCGRLIRKAWVTATEQY